MKERSHPKSPDEASKIAIHPDMGTTFLRVADSVIEKPLLVIKVFCVRLSMDQNFPSAGSANNVGCPIDDRGAESSPAVGFQHGDPTDQIRIFLPLFTNPTRCNGNSVFISDKMDRRPIVIVKLPNKSLFCDKYA